jgi:hypothetical protein
MIVLPAAENNSSYVQPVLSEAEALHTSTFNSLIINFKNINTLQFFGVFQISPLGDGGLL